MKKVASEIKAMEPTAMYLHCFAHNLNLEVADTFKSVKLMFDTLDHSLEICKLIKASPTREAILAVKEGIGTTWTWFAKLVSTKMDCSCSIFQSIRENYAVLNVNCHEALDVAIQSGIKARINGVAAKMKEFKFLFGFMLAEKLQKHSDNFSRTIQATSMPAIQAHRSEVCALKSCSV